MVRAQHLIQRRGLRQHHQHHDAEREGRQALAADVEHAPDGREPMRVDRHRPVDHREGDGEEVEDKTGARQARHLIHQLRVARAIVLGRPRGQQITERRPDREVDDLANQEEGRVQVRGLLHQDRVGQRAVMRPLVEVVHAERDRQEQHRHKWDGADRRFERPPQHNAPRAAGEVLHHQQRQAAKSHAGPEGVGDQVSLEKALGALLARHHEAGAGQHHAQRGRNEAELLQAWQRRVAGLERFRSDARH